MKTTEVRILNISSNKYEICSLQNLFDVQATELHFLRYISTNPY